MKVRNKHKVDCIQRHSVKIWQRPQAGVTWMHSAVQHYSFAPAKKCVPRATGANLPKTRFALRQGFGSVPEAVCATAQESSCTYCIGCACNRSLGVLAYMYLMITQDLPTSWPAPKGITSTTASFWSGAGTIPLWQRNVWMRREALTTHIVGRVDILCGSVVQGY